MANNQEKDKKNISGKARRNGRIAFGVAFLGIATSIGIHGLFGLLLTLGVSTFAKKFVESMSDGLDLTTHNRQDEAKKKPEPEVLPLSGNEEADAVIAKGQEMLKAIREANDAIPDAALTNQMDDLERMCTQIFKTIADKPAKAPQIRKFMNYYLPTTLKMLASYRIMEERGVSAGDLIEARTTLIRGMNMVLTACQKQLDNLFKDDLLDVSTDIDVLEQMLKRDGFTDGGLGNVQPGPSVQQPAAEPVQVPVPDTHVPTRARTAASAQMGTDKVPTIDTNPDSSKKEEEFRSFYHQNGN